MTPPAAPTVRYIVISDEGLEGNFPTLAAAEGYLQELREQGARQLRIETQPAERTPFHPDVDAVDPYGRL